MRQSNVVIGPLQLEVLEVLWVEGTLDVKDVYGHLRVRRLTTGKPRITSSTVNSVLRALTFKSYVSAEKRNGRYHFTAVVTRIEILSQILQSAADLVAGGDISTLLEKAKVLCSSQPSIP